MARIRSGTKEALIIVGTQVGVFARVWEAPRLVQTISKTVENARNKGIPIIWIQHHDAEIERNSPEWHIVPQLVPTETEPVVHKNYNSGFENTVLESTLQDLGVCHIVLAGAATNWCIRATAYAALERGYDLNTVMQWISYPDRASRCVTSLKWLEGLQ